MSSEFNSMDAVIEVYKKDVDIGLLRANLALTVEERLMQLQRAAEIYEALREAGEKLRRGHGISTTPGGSRR